MSKKSKFALVGLYWRTIRHLKISQIFGYLSLVFKKKWLFRTRFPKIISKQLRTSSELTEKPIELKLRSPCFSSDAGEIVNSRFTFINQVACLGKPVDWVADEMPRLWRYNLHYFDWMWSLRPGKNGDWENARQFIQDWIDHHPPSEGAEGWEPYPCSLRLINWSVLVGLRYREELLDDPPFQRFFLESIEQQARWLSKNLEIHIQANHLLENLAALTCVAAVFEGPFCDLFRDRVTSMLERELTEQVLPDGMHYERSPMYHLRVLWVVELLSQLGNPQVSVLAEMSLTHMRQALAHLRHPDGEIALLNDASLGIYQDYWQSEPSFGPWSLPDAGYYGYRDKDGSYLIVDAGAIGPDHQPGHAHADYLSFELSMHGHRMITDTGIGTYDTGGRRSYDRSTAAHSTVEIAGQNSAEVWGGFRVGRRVTPEVLEWSGDSESKGGIFLHARHNGYKYLPCNAVHSRSFKWTDEGLEIQDSIQATQETNAVSRLHFSPECELTVDSGEVRIDLHGRQYRCLVEDDCEMFVERRSCCLEFGQDQDRSVLVMRHRVSTGETKWKVWIGPAMQVESRKSEVFKVDE